MSMLSGCIVLSVAFVLLVGCSRAKQDEPAVPERLSPTPVRPEASLLGVGVERDSKPVKPEERIEAGIVDASMVPIRVNSDALPFRVCALFPGGETEARAGLVSLSDGSARIVAVGDTFLGYKLTAIDFSGGDVVFRHEGRSFIIGISSSQLSGNVQTTPPGQGGLDGSWTGWEEVAETNAEAWFGQAVRGPAADATPKVVTAEDAFPGDVAISGFEPTKDERARAIDPNDPDTWPDDYMGPGIERARKMSDEQ